MKTVDEYKKYIWGKIKEGVWSPESLLSLNDNVENIEWNKAIKSAKEWARLELIKKYSEENKNNIDIYAGTTEALKSPGKIVKRNKTNIEPEIMEALQNIKERKKEIRNTKRPEKKKYSKKDFKEKSYKQYIDEGIAGTREESKKMKYRQSGTNKYNKIRELSAHKTFKPTHKAMCLFDASYFTAKSPKNFNTRALQFEN